MTDAVKSESVIHRGHNCPRRGHICTPERGFTPPTPLNSDAMVSKERIKEEGLTKSDVLDYEVVDPPETVEYMPEWDHEAEAPGENVHIEDETLYWERDGFEVALWNHEPTYWKVEIDVPDEYGTTHPREIDVKCKLAPEYGFVESAEIEGYVLQGLTLVISENYMPTFEVNKWIDDLIEGVESFEEYQVELEEKLELAAENED